MIWLGILIAAVCVWVVFDEYRDRKYFEIEADARRKLGHHPERKKGSFCLRCGKNWYDQAEQECKDVAVR